MADNISLLAVSEAGGGGAMGVYDLNTLPIFPINNSNLKTFIASSAQTIFFTGETNGRSLANAPSCFQGTKGTGWTTVFNHSGSGSLIWFCTSSFNTNTGRVILKLTVDGEVRETDITMTSTSTSNGQARIFCGNLYPVQTNQELSVYTGIQWQGTSFGNFEYINATWTAPYGGNNYVPLSVGGARAAGANPLKYETNLKIEVYNSHTATAAAGNYYGGMVIQGY